MACECHPRDSSYRCNECFASGARGHMQELECPHCGATPERGEGECEPGCWMRDGQAARRKRLGNVEAMESAIREVE